MKRIIEGLQKFQDEIFPEERELFESLASRQNPEALFITCSDSRIVPGMLTQTKPGDIFISRNVGNIAPPYGEVSGGVSATIEYAVLALEVRDIIVCGHSDCGVMKAALHPESVNHLPSVSAWLRHTDRARFVVQESYNHLPEHEQLKVLTEQNVVAQLENLRTHPAVASRVLRGELNLHGWVYNIQTGTVTNYVPGERAFVPFREMPVTARSDSATERSHA